MKLAVAQIKTTPGAFDQTIEAMLNKAHAAKEAGASLLVFPGPVIGGLDTKPLEDYLHFIADMMQALERFASQTPLACIVPMAWSIGINRNEVLLIENGHMIPLRSMHSMNVLSISENPLEHMVDMRQAQFEFEGLQFLLVFDYENLIEDNPRLSQADVVLYIDQEPFDFTDSNHPAVLLGSRKASSFLQGEDREERLELQKTLKNAGCWLVLVEGVGGYADRIMTGGSCIISPWQDIVAQAPNFEEALLITEIERFYEGTHNKTYDVNALYISTINFLWRALEMALHDYVQNKNASGVSLVLDGSLGSCALLALSVDAVGLTKVHVILPPRTAAQAIAAYDDAYTMAAELGVDSYELCDYLGIVENRELDEQTTLNLMSAALSSLSVKNNYLALSSYDKTYASVMASDSRVDAGSYAPFGDVFRSTLVDMVLVRNSTSPIIPSTASSRLDLPDDLLAELSGKSDIVKLKELDEILYYYLIDGSEANVVADDTEHRAKGYRAMVSRIIDRQCSCELARRKLPSCVAITGHALRSWHWPLALVWRDTVVDAKDYSEDMPSGEAIFEDANERLNSLLRQATMSVDNDIRGIDVSQMMNFVNGFIQEGGLNLDTEDVWGSGMFSNN